MQNAIEVVSSAIDLGLTVGQVKSLLKKKGFSETEIESALLEAGLTSARRETFRTEFERALISAIVENEQTVNDAILNDTFEETVNRYYPNGRKDPKASNTIRHEDYYKKTYGSFAKALLEAI
jgi:hypothetical protein